jgi:hypothetical protein
MRRFLFILLACCIFLTLKAQTFFTVLGTVADEKGQLLPGTNLKAATTGTTSNITSNFTSSVPSAQSHLTVTFIGYYKACGDIASCINGDKKYNFRQSVTTNIAKRLTSGINSGFNDINYKQPNTSKATLWSS